MLAAALLAAIKTVTLTILPLGDSITEGVPTVDGYRAALATELSASGIQVRYVGSLRSPAGAHEGWSGYTAAELLPRARSALARHRPDVVLLHIGTNDLGIGVPVDEAVANVRALLLVIDERSRSGPADARPIRVLLARIVPRNLFLLGGRDTLLETYNDRLAALAAERRRARQPVEIVDLQRALDPDHDLADALHPSEQGYAKIARGWARAIARLYAPRR